jgi:hypothetical protein
MADKYSLNDTSWTKITTRGRAYVISDGGFRLYEGTTAPSSLSDGTALLSGSGLYIESKAGEYLYALADGDHTTLTVFESQYRTYDYDDMSRGLVKGTASQSTNGQRTAAGAETNTPICPCATSIERLPEAGVQLTFQSTDDEDAVGGTGVETLLMTYLDANLDVQTESITLTGTTPKLTDATDIRFVNSCIATSVGSTGAAVGTITGEYLGEPYAGIYEGDTVQTSSYMMVPRGKAFYAERILISSISATADAQTVIRVVVDTGSGIYYSTNAIGVQNGGLVIPLRTTRGLAAGTVLGLTHTTDKAATVTGSILGRMEDA